MDAALDAGAGRLVHTSSIAALGRPERPGGVLDESARWTPSRSNSAYGASKRDAEREVLRAVAEGLDAVTVNPALVFGPGARPGEGHGPPRRAGRRRAASRSPRPAARPSWTWPTSRPASAPRASGARRGERYVLASENLSWTAILGTLAETLGAAPAPGRRLARPSSALPARWAAWAGAATRSEPPLTRATARAAAETHRYANDKAVRDLGLSFRPFAETAARIAEATGDG